MVRMRVAVDENLDVFQFKSQLLDVLPDQRHGLGEAAIEKDVALRRGNEIGGDVARAHIINVVDDTKRLYRLIPRAPFSRRLSPGEAGQKQQRDDGEAFLNG